MSEILSEKQSGLFIQLWQSNVGDLILRSLPVSYQNTKDFINDYMMQIKKDRKKCIAFIDFYKEVIANDIMAGDIYMYLFVDNDYNQVIAEKLLETLADKKKMSTYGLVLDYLESRVVHFNVGKFTWFAQLIGEKRTADIIKEKAKFFNQGLLEYCM
jgi:hypothetical protein